MNRLFLAGVLLPLFIGCSGVDQARTVFIPNIDLQCTESQVDDCAIAGHARTFRVGLTAGSIADCLDLINSAGSQFSVAFAYSGTATSEFLNDVLRGSVLQWQDGEGNTASEIEAGFYTVCAHLDTDQNGLLSAGEPVASKVISVSLPDQLIEDWGAFSF